MRINMVIDRLSNLKLWWFFFLYTFCVSALVQIILLPYVFPGLHAGNGLFNISLDSIGFHKLAVGLADKIRLQGWPAWQLNPEGQAPAGIAALFYVFILPDPRVLIPINAALHAGAALALASLINLFVKNKAKAVICVLPFLAFPSNLQWIAQWHRDIFSILGIILFVRGVVSLSMPENYKAGSRFLIDFRSVIFCVCGYILIWLVRPYIITIILPFAMLSFPLLFLAILIKAFRKRISWQTVPRVLLSMLLVLFIFIQIKACLYANDFPKPAITDQPIINKPPSIISKQPSVINKPPSIISKQPSVINKPQIERGTLSKSANTAKSINKYNVEEYWKRSPWLPSSIDKMAYYLALIRQGFCYAAPEARSNIDCDIGFNSIKDILIYLPRAFQIAFLAPFPNQWFTEGTYPASSMMRRIAACEMVVVYFALLFLPYALWHWRKRVEIWPIFIFCIYMLVVYGLVVSNIGTLYRMRYVYITTLVAFGIAGFITFLENLKIKKQQTALAMNSVANTENKMKAIFVSNTSLTIRNFRTGLMQALKSKGYDVIFCAQDNGYAEEVIKKGFAYIPLTIDRKSTNFLTDLKQTIVLYRMYKKEKPDIVLHYTIKPNIYGSLAAALAGVPCINNITGLGYVFIKRNPIYFLVKILYKVSSGLAKRTFFQNKDDLCLFLEKGLVDKNKTVLVNGSGVNTSFFNPDFYRSVKKEEDSFVFLFTGRFLWDKGLGEFVDAARLTKQIYPKTQFWLAGILDQGNPAGISLETIKEWEREGIITYHGEIKDVRPLISQADCVVLPSYREGIPRSLLEASAMGKPIITTNVAGCREVVENGINGFSVPVKNKYALFNSFCKIIKLKPEERLRMGKAGREKVKKEFEESIVIDTYLKEIEQIVS